MEHNQMGIRLPYSIEYLYLLNNVFSIGHLCRLKSIMTRASFLLSLILIRRRMLLKFFEPADRLYWPLNITNKHSELNRMFSTLMGFSRLMLSSYFVFFFLYIFTWTNYREADANLQTSVIKPTRCTKLNNT